MIVKYVQPDRSGIQAHNFTRHSIGYVVRGKKCVYYGDVCHEIPQGTLFYMGMGNHYTEDVPEQGKNFEQIVFYYTSDQLSRILNHLSVGYQLNITNDHSCPNCENQSLWTAEDTDYNHLTGTEFAAMSDEELLGRVQALKIMSRARPLDKQRLVRLLQQRGEVVAVTGDGTNDAPALNFAQVGLSMGSGTSVAKEASDITLMDDSFSSIATAVMWGRSLYKNIQRFVLFQLTINFVAIVIVLLGSIFGSQLPLTVTQMLWVNLIMDTFAALALASLPPSRSVMREKPRKNSDFIITRPMIRSIVGVGIVFVAALLGMLAWFGQGITPYELSVFFTVFVMLQFWNMFNAKGFGSRSTVCTHMKGCSAFYGVLLLILVGQIAIVTWGGDVFRTVPITLRDWAIIVGGTSLVMWAGELSRWIKRRQRA